MPRPSILAAFARNVLSSGVLNAGLRLLIPEPNLRGDGEVGQTVESVTSAVETEAGPAASREPDNSPRQSPGPGFLQAIFGGEVEEETLVAFRAFEERLIRNMTYEFGEHNAQDALQDALLKAFDLFREGRLININEPTRWIAIVAKNNARTLARKWKSHKDVGKANPDSPASTDLEDREEREIKVAAVRKAFGGLRDDQQNVLRLCDHEGLTIRETAERLGISQGSASGLRTRAHEKLRAKLAPVINPDARVAVARASV